MTTTARYAGTCTRCKGPIAYGERIEWTPGQGARHATTSQCSEVAASPVSAPFDGQPIRSFLQKAIDNGLKMPKARFLGPDGQSELRLSLASKTSRNPGAIYITLSDEYLGLVAPDGSARGRFLQMPDVIDTLSAIVVDPAEAARRYGALMCRCSFCGLSLTDAGSVIAGYGPICAKKWDLPHEALGTPTLSEVPK